MLGISNRILIGSEVLAPLPELTPKIPSLTQISEISILFLVNVPVLSVAQFYRYQNLPKSVIAPNVSIPCKSFTTTFLCSILRPDTANIKVTVSGSP
jgi:hypothetical protein